MPLKGDLSTIGLAEVFQMLSLSQKEGTLIVQNEESKRCIYFSRQGISLLSSGQRRGVRLGDILLKHGKINAKQLDEALAVQKQGKSLIGEILVQRGYTNQEEIDRFMRTKIEDEICDLFMWKKASFEFVEGAPPPEFRDPLHHVTTLALDVNSLLLEALRRVDEWKLMSGKVSGDEEIFVVDAMTKLELLRLLTDERKKAIVREIDGINNIREIGDLLAYSTFDVCRFLIELIDQKMARRSTPRELAAKANELLRAGNQPKALELMKAATALGEGDGEILVQYAEVAEAGGDREASADSYGRAGALFRQQGELEKAASCYQQAIERKADAIPLRSALFDLQLEMKDSSGARTSMTMLLPLLLAKGEIESGKNLCLRSFDPAQDDFVCAVLLAELYQRLANSSDSKKMIKAARRLLPIDSETRRNAFHTIEQSLNGDRSILALFEEKKRSVKGGWKRVAIFVILGAVLLGATIVLKFELDAQREFEEAMAQVRDLEAKEEFVQARDLLRQFSERHASLIVWSVDRVGNEIFRIEREIEKRRKSVPDPTAKIRESADGLIKKARIARTNGELSLAIQHAHEAEAIAKKNGFDEVVKTASEIVTEAEDYIRGANDLFSKASALEKEGKFSSAVLAMKELADRFPQSDAAKRAYYPLRITTHPSGAKIYFNNTESGTTPVTLRLPLRGKDSIRLDRKGYEMVNALIEDSMVGEMFFELKKVYKWRTAVGGMVRSSVVAQDGVLYVSAKNAVYALNAENGKLLWEYALGGDIESSPVVHKGIVYIGCLDKSLYAIKDGRLLWTLPTEGMIRSDLSFSQDGTLALFGSDDGVLCAVHTAGGKIEWKMKIPSIAITAPVLRGKVLYIGCANGSVYAFSVEDQRRVLWEFKTPGTPSELEIDGDRIYVGCTDRKVYAIKRESGVMQWDAPLGGEISSMPALVGKNLLVACKDSFVYLLQSGDGAILARYKTGGPVCAAPAVGNGCVMFGSDDGVCYCFDMASGALLWQYNAGTPIRSRPFSGERVLFFGADDKNIYAIDVQ